MKRLVLAAASVLALLWGEARAAPPLEAYGKLPAVENVQMSPAGDRLALIATDVDARKLVVLGIADGATLIAANVGGQKVREIDWLDEDHIMIIVSATLDWGWQGGKFESGSAVIVDVTTGKAFDVFGGAGTMMRATAGFYGVAREGGKTYAFFGGAPRDAAHVNLYRVSVEDGHADFAAGRDTLLDLDWVVGADGAILAHTEYDFRSGEMRLYETGDNRSVIDTERDPLHEFVLVGPGEKTGQYLMHTGDGVGGWRLEEYTAGSGAAPTTLMDGRAVRSLIIDPDTRLLLGAVTQEDEPKTILLDPAKQAKFDKVRRLFAGETVELVSPTGSLDKMVVYTTGPQDSGTYFLIDIPKGQARAIGWSYPGVAPADVGPSQVVHYQAADGLKLQGILTLPPARPAKALPLVVLPHGGPEDRDYLGFDWWAQAYASRGYAVFQPNFRGSDGFGPAFRDAGFGEWGRKMQTDISDGVAELTRQGVVDPKRACIVGASYGGYAALAGVTLQQGLYRCAVAVAGVSDLSREALDEVQYGWVARYLRAFLGVKGETDPALKAISPIRFADRADAPILLIHGRDDTVVPIVESRDMRDTLQRGHKDVQLIELLSEDHWLSRTATRKQMLEASVAFVEKYNPPD